ncbi:Hypothetical protein, putative [Bodo saltans]|uniref:Uncharacterized protein n=1 Tax=Bodo saltans TaxID=75058 RepID=A0A0S4J6I2_BODSA|nr:Hypothetical protein, putative [Bodo saltans]|eukprot:CUG85045.1 Hypothetical protein, putative [Bodo saltans]
MSFLPSLSRCIGFDNCKMMTLFVLCYPQSVEKVRDHTRFRCSRTCAAHDQASPELVAKPQPTPLARLAEHLQSTKLEAAQIDSALRSKIAEQQLAMSITDIGRLEIESRRLISELGNRDPVAALTAQISAQELRHLEPWRKRFQQLALRKEAYMQTDPAELKKKCSDLAKDAQLSPTEVLLLWTALYADPEERMFLASIVLSESDSDRLPQFNFHIATKKGTSFLSQFGEALTTFSLPLFPADEAYDLTNAKLLRDAVNGSRRSSVEPSGAGTTAHTVFRRARGQDDILGTGTFPVTRRARGQDDILGTGTFPVTTNPQTGAPEVDVTQVELAFDNRLLPAAHTVLQSRRAGKGCTHTRERAYPRGEEASRADVRRARTTPRRCQCTGDGSVPAAEPPAPSSSARRERQRRHTTNHVGFLDRVAADPKQHVNQNTGRSLPLARRFAPRQSACRTAGSAPLTREQLPRPGHTLAKRDNTTTRPPRRGETTSPASPLAGAGECLSADDLDRLVGAHTQLPAAAFFRWRNGGITTTDLRAQLTRAREWTPTLFIVHARFHWVATELTNDQWIIWDSAPSRAVRADIAKFAKNLCLPDPTFLPAPQQATGSMECGLFAALFTLLRAAGRPIPPHASIALAPLRAHLNDHKTFFTSGNSDPRTDQEPQTTAPVALLGADSHPPHAPTICTHHGRRATATNTAEPTAVTTSRASTDTNRTRNGKRTRRPISRTGDQRVPSRMPHFRRRRRYRGALGRPPRMRRLRLNPRNVERHCRITVVR